MKFCKYCNKPIDDESVWNPDKDGNGYHHSCLCEMEFKSRDKRIYDKGRTDVLEKIRAEIEQERVHNDWDFGQERYYNNAIDDVLAIIDKYAEQEPKSPCDLCRFDYMDGVCGDCSAMVKGR